MRDIRLQFRRILAFIAMFAGLVIVPCASAAEEVLRLGVFAYRPKPLVEQQYRPLVDYLNQQLQNTRIELKVLEQPEIEQALDRNELDLVFTNPSHFTLLRLKYNLSGAIATLVAKENGLPVNQLGGVIFTRSDNKEIETLEDIKGRTIAAPGFKFLGGFQTQSFELLQRDIHLPADVASIEELKGHDNVVMHVLAGKAEVGFIRTGIIEAMAEAGEIDPAQIRVVNPQKLPYYPFLLSTRLYPEWAFAALPHVNEKTVRKIARALLTIEHDSPIAESAKIYGFTVPADYLPVENLARALRLPPFEKAPEFTLEDAWSKWKLQISLGALSALVISLLVVWLVLTYKKLKLRQRIIEQQHDELVNNELRYRTVANYTHDWEYWLGPDGSVRFMSPSCKAVTGYSLDEFVATPSLLLDIVHPEDRSKIEAHFGHINKEGEFESFDFRIVHRDGEIRWIEHACQSVFDDAGNYNGRRVANRDITDRKIAEEKLSASESRLRTIIESEPECIKIVDANGILLEMNSAGLAMLEADELSQVAGQPVVNVIAPKYRFAYSKLHKKVIGGTPQTMEYEVIGLKGGHRWLETHAVPMRQPNGETIHLAITRDITESKQAAVAAASNAQYTRSLIEASLDPLVTISAEGKVTDVNLATEKVTGLTRDELIGTDFSDYFTEPEKARLGYREVFDKGFVTDYPLAIRHKDGHVTDVFYNASVYRDQSGNVAGVFAAARDITEQRNAERSLREAKVLAETLAATKSEFLANMSHEIRTPMNGIIGLSQLALNQPTSPVVRDYLEKISNSSQSLLGILNDILDFSKLEAGRMNIENTPFDMDILLDNLRNLFEERSEAKHLKFDIAVAEGTPRDLIGDALRIQQILSNLLGNAIKFTSEGHLKLNISGQLEEESKALITFIVEDTGIGMSPADMTKLFQPFSQADGSITRKFGGTGLGLAISQSLLKLMGSEFSVSSHRGQGTTFSFSLRLGVVSHHKVRESRHRIRHEAGYLEKTLKVSASALQGARILVAEDNMINQQVVREFLKLCGIETSIAYNGQEALEQLKTQAFDAILMDVQMPVMGGIEATQQIRANPDHANLPIIALTAGVTQEEREGYQKCGMNDFVAKPVNPAHLIETLLRWVKPAGQSNFTAQPAATVTTWEEIEGLLPEFDFGHLETLIGKNTELLKELLGQFLNDYASESGAIMSHIVKNELDAAEKSLHKLKGAAGNLGAFKLHGACQTLDDQLKNGGYDQDSLGEWLRLFNSTLADISHALDQMHHS